MSELNLFQKLFSRKATPPVDEAQVPSFEASLNSETQHPRILWQLQLRLQVQKLQWSEAAVQTGETSIVSEADLLDIPILGKRTVVAASANIGCLAGVGFGCCWLWLRFLR